MTGTFALLISMAWRNLWSRPGKSLIAGSLMAFGAFLFVVGTAMLDSIEATMTKSVTSSVAGHLQVYDADARDDLALFGSGFMGQDDIGMIPDFGPVKTLVAADPNVKAVVPMGLGYSITSSPSDVERLIAACRAAVDGGDAAAFARSKGRLLRAVKQLEGDVERARALAADAAELDANREVLATVQSGAFWREDERGLPPPVVLEFLETKLAPVGGDAWIYYLRYLGTDLSNYESLFPRMEIIKGEGVPVGERGFLFAEHMYERYLKHKVARELDAIHRATTEEERTIADDVLLRDRVARLRNQYLPISMALDADAREQVTAALAKHLGQEEALEPLLQAFLAVDDEVFAERYRFFYEAIAPHMPLYAFKPGDVITLRSFTRNGYMRAKNVKVYGVFRFRGMERSQLAGMHNLMDLMTFRDLYGLMTQEKLAELEAIRAQVGVTDVGRDEAEDALFGGEIESEEGVVARFDEELKVERQEANPRFTQAELEKGIALNAAIILEDGALQEQTQQRLQASLSAAGHNLQVVPWQKASGMVGQFIVIMRAVLYIGIFIVFLVVLVIINNSMVMATMDRVAEIGTLRAIGAGRPLVVGIFLVETLVLAALAATAGALGAAGLMQRLGEVGIAAPHNILIFLFGGPRLYPFVATEHWLLGVVVMVLASALATLYPAALASRVQPVVAMQPRE